MIEGSFFNMRKEILRFYKNEQMFFIFIGYYGNNKR